MAVDCSCACRSYVEGKCKTLTGFTFFSWICNKQKIYIYIFLTLAKVGQNNLIEVVTVASTKLLIEFLISCWNNYRQFNSLHWLISLNNWQPLSTSIWLTGCSTLCWPDFSSANTALYPAHPPLNLTPSSAAHFVPSRQGHFMSVIYYVWTMTPCPCPLAFNTGHKTDSSFGIW